MNRMQIHTTLAAAALTFASALSGIAQAGPSEGTINLLTTPPELTAKVAPNVVLTFDDSGSMAWTYMPDQRPYDGGGWGNPYRCAAVIDPRVDEDPTNPRSWSMNGVYYNPNSDYKPPLYADGSEFPPASYTAAWDNGIQHNRPVGRSNSSTRNLGNYKGFCGNGPGYYRLKTSVNLTLGADGNISNTGTLYTSSNWEWVALPASQRQNFANWYSYYRVRQYAAISATSRAFAGFDRGIRVAWQNINDSSNRINPGTTIVSPFEGTTKTSFYSWLFRNPASGGTPNQTASNRVGELFSYGQGVANARNPYWEPDLGRELACRKNFHIQMTDGIWNGATSSPGKKDTTSYTLPDGRMYSTSDAESKVFWNEDGANKATMADIAFHYWATDLRPDLDDDVRPYLGDSSTGVTANIPLQMGDNWRDNKEVYWNPVNNPATWQHLVQYMIGFGVSGTIPKTPHNYLELRKGNIKWPEMPSTDRSEKIDDMWHAAINSRGEFFTASDPDELVNALQKIIASVVAQTTSSTPAAVSLPILTGGNSFYEGGYDSNGWPGKLIRRKLDQSGQPGDAEWDAGCLLTGGQCPEPVGTNTARAPNSRIIITSKNGAGEGIPFRWSSLTSEQQTALNAGGHGSLRVDYLRGDRSNEPGAASPQFRPRSSVLRAIINSEPVYVSSPRSGYRDMFPPGSPEAEAAAEDEALSYAGYQNAKATRRPVVYAGANDGMLHAFDAKTGQELWAYAPDTLIRNGRLQAMTAADADLVPGVDSAVRERDVFLKRDLLGLHGSWRTILLGSLRLGGRGIYALDVTDPTPANENAAGGTDGLVLWEFTSGDTVSAEDDEPCAAGSRSCASLGYTYDSANVARIKYEDKWVAVVSSGYFPENGDVAAKPTDISEPAAKRTSLLVIDLATGELIREIRTSLAPQTRPSGFKTYGLSTPMVYDEGSDQVDDVVYAGDLAGNLWRFDLSSDDPADWSVDLMFTTYDEGGADEAGHQPFVFNPTALRDPVTRRPILVIGSGKYLGEDDRTSLIKQQAYYGIRDYGPGSEYYPIRPEQLVTQKLEQTGSEREITGYTKPAVGKVQAGTPAMRMASNDSGSAIVSNVPAHGWRMPLDIAAEPGERAQRRAIPMTTANVAILYGLIPKSDDPCDPGARYSVMVVGGATGSALAVGEDEVAGSGEGVVGGVAATPSPPADPVVVRGGGRVVIPGLSDQLGDDVKDALDAATPPWHRGAWRDLLDW